MSSNSGSGAPGGKMRRQPRDLGFQVADQLRIDAGKLAGRLVEPLGNVFEPRFQAADRRVAGTARACRCPALSAQARRSAASIAFMMRLLSSAASAWRCVDLVGDLVEAAARARERADCPARSRRPGGARAGRKHVEALLDAGEDLIGIGHRRRVVDLVGDHGDLIGKPFDRLFRHGGARRDFVDPLRKQVQPLDDLAAGPVLGDFLDLPGQRRDARLDAFERLGIEMRLTARRRSEPTMAREISSRRSSIMGEGLRCRGRLLARRNARARRQACAPFPPASAATAIPAGC